MFKNNNLLFKRTPYGRFIFLVGNSPPVNVRITGDPLPTFKLGTADSTAYKEMLKAIARRNEIQRLLKKLETLEKQVNADKFKPRKPRQPGLTTLVIATQY
ncbi:MULTISPECIES: hypothetical protein [Crocosphaera]|uniref:hypothetical protein n=1 Tax=Crocosphaera TaxID=263510 RepID=UPI0006829D15|nr:MULTISPECIES: hypothetical protein [Crocosphaera]NQZ64446.1 hypothetical protein [Crocosphaera sp.]